MPVKSIIKYFLILTVSLASCVKYPPYELPTDQVREKKSATAKLLTKSLASDSISHNVQWLQSMGTRFALAGNHREVAVSIRNKFRKMGYTDARLDSFDIAGNFRSVPYTSRQYNVIAELRGSRYPDSLMIIGSHYDDFAGPGDPIAAAPGANDNASGVAAMMEIARAMKRNDYEPLSSIHFVAFAAEELGLLGSYNYAGKMFPSGKNVKLMINNDMIANVSNSNTTTWKVNIVNYDNAVDLVEKSRSMCNLYTFISTTNDNTYFKSSDSYPFYMNRYKAVFYISASEDAFYHTTGDTYDKLNFIFCTEVAKLSCALLVWSDTHEL